MLRNEELGDLYGPPTVTEANYWIKNQLNRWGKNIVPLNQNI